MTKTLLATLALALAVVVLGACRGGGSAKGAAHRPQLPKALNTIEEQAEDIIDVVPAGKWDQAGADVTAVVDAWRTYRPRALRDGADQALVLRFDAALADLRASAGAKGPDQTMQAANDLSAATVELFALYEIGRPVDIGRLDVIGRQIAFDAGHRNLGAAGRQLDKAQAIWEGGLRSDIVHHDGKKVAEHTDASLAALRKARDAGDFEGLRKQAGVFLEIVDDMERLY